MTWLDILLGGGGWVVVMGGLLHILVRTGRILEKLDQQDNRIGRLEGRVDNLTNGRGRLHSSH